MLFDCPECGQTLKAADDAAGKKCRCSNCNELVAIPGRPTKSKTSKPQSAAPSSAKPASVASELNDMIVRQNEQILEHAVATLKKQEAAQRRAEHRDRYGQRESFESSSSTANSANPILKAVLTGVLVLAVVCCGLFGFFAMGRSSELKAGGYAATARGHGKVLSKSDGDVRGEGILNRMTGSEFWLYVSQLPSGDAVLTRAVMERFGARSTEQKPVQRGGLSGNHFSNVEAESLSIASKVQAEMEVFVASDKMIVALYIPGSAKAKAGIQRKSTFEGSEDLLDSPESFFESIKFDSR